MAYVLVEQHHYYASAMNFDAITVFAGYCVYSSCACGANGVWSITNLLKITSILDCGDYITPF